MEIKRVALLGAGAVGAYFIQGLVNVPGIDFCVVAEGERRERLLQEGRKINGETVHFPVCTPEEARGCDLLLVAVKYAALPEALPAISEIAVPGVTTVMSLLNGVDSEEIIAEKIGMDPIVHAYMVIASERVGNSIRFDPEVTKGLVFGEAGTQDKTPRCTAIETLFASSRVRARFVPDIQRQQWGKFCRNLSYNIPQAILGVGIGAFADSDHVRAVSEALESEVIAVGAAYGVDVPRIDRLFNTRYSKKNRYSTLQDLDAKRHTEVDMFCGVLMKKAEAKGLSVPTAATCYHLIRALEEKNDGKFDYN